MNILVSECLLGVDCNYKGTNKKNEKIIGLLKEHHLIPICPEQLGGLTTPRLPSENQNQKVFMVNGDDVTQNYQKGANMSLYLAKLYNAKYAILKSRSPSCGYGEIYDGTFSGTIIKGNGTTSDLLSQNGIKIFNEENIDLLIEELKKEIN
ncbi:MAG: DUF523 domain-containing protein [Clostridia bacterium]|nr:DUF523 domain-containing protein [Clostridia bacterium]